ncbi:hypothetical protein OAO87_02100 [bacterium]|nr:hypothetical protein [bacterium]
MPQEAERLLRRSIGTMAVSLGATNKQVLVGLNQLGQLLHKMGKREARRRSSRPRPTDPEACCCLFSWRGSRHRLPQTCRLPRLIG